MPKYKFELIVEAGDINTAYAIAGDNLGCFDCTVVQAVPCYVCKTEVALEDALLVEGRVVCPRHGADKGQKPAPHAFEGGDALKYVRFADGRVVLWHSTISARSHQQVASDEGGKPISAGTISHQGNNFKMMNRGSMTLKIATTADGDEDLLAVVLGLPYGGMM